MTVAFHHIDGIGIQLVRMRMTVLTLVVRGRIREKLFRRHEFLCGRQDARTAHK